MSLMMKVCGVVLLFLSVGCSSVFAYSWDSEKSESSLSDIYRSRYNSQKSSVRTETVPDKSDEINESASTGSESLWNGWSTDIEREEKTDADVLSGSSESSELPGDAEQNLKDEGLSLFNEASVAAKNEVIEDEPLVAPVIQPKVVEVPAKIQTPAEVYASSKAETEEKEKKRSWFGWGSDDEEEEKEVEPVKKEVVSERQKTHRRQSTAESNTRSFKPVKRTSAAGSVSGKKTVKVKVCSKCGREYTDMGLIFCPKDGSPLKIVTKDK